ncbi:hypothetical protein Hanom_Chr10g00885951 [Helianthus anomalus]
MLHWLNSCPHISATYKKNCLCEKRLRQNLFKSLKNDFFLFNLYSQIIINIAIIRVSVGCRVKKLVGCKAHPHVKLQILYVVYAIINHICFTSLQKPTK